MKVDVTTYDLKDKNGNVIKPGYFQSVISVPSEKYVESSGIKQPLKIGMEKRQIAIAFNGIPFNIDQWKRMLADAPKWLLDCRVSRGRRGRIFSATLNPVLIAIALLDKSISIKKLDAVFITLKDWQQEWAEESERFR